MINIKDLPADKKRSAIATVLSEGVSTVSFTKVDGTHRDMPCTLDPKLIPPPVEKPLKEGEVKKEVKVNPAVMRVFCTDKNEWRSFRVDSVIAID